MWGTSTVLYNKHTAVRPPALFGPPAYFPLRDIQFVQFGLISGEESAQRDRAAVHVHTYFFRHTCGRLPSPPIRDGARLV